MAVFIPSPARAPRPLYQQLFDKASLAKLIPCFFVYRNSIIERRIEADQPEKELERLWLQDIHEGKHVFVDMAEV